MGLSVSPSSPQDLSMSLYWPLLLERDEVGGLDGTHTRLAILHSLLHEGELPQVVADHLWFDFHLVEDLAVTHAHHAAYHFKQDDPVSQVCC